MQNFKFHITILVGILGILSPVFAADLHWKNSGSSADMCLAKSYVENQKPEAGDTIYFSGPAVAQPYLSADLEVKCLYFGPADGSLATKETDPNGYVFTSVSGKTLTLSASSAPVINANALAAMAVFRIPVALNNTDPSIRASGMQLCFEGSVFRSSGSTTCKVDAGGVLVNSSSNAGISWEVGDQSWLGGTGTVTSVTVKSGGHLRPGMNGRGNIIISGSSKSTFAQGGGLHVNIAADGSAPYMVAKGTVLYLSDSGAEIVVDGAVGDLAPGFGRVKIMDWTPKTSNLSSSTMFVASKYTVKILDPKRFKSASLEKAGKMFYLNYEVARPDGFSMVFRP